MEAVIDSRVLRFCFLAVWKIDPDASKMFNTIKDTKTVLYFKVYLDHTNILSSKVIDKWDINIMKEE